jgi:hypothetical protein
VVELQPFLHEARAATDETIDDYAKDVHIMHM